VLHPREVIGDKNPGDFSIETNVIIIVMLVMVEARWIATGNSFHLTLIPVFLFLVLMFNAP